MNSFILSSRWRYSSIILFLNTFFDKFVLTETARIISRNPQCKVFNSDNFHMFSCSRNMQVTFVLVNNQYQNFKHWYLIHTWSHKAFKGTFVNRTLPFLHERSLKITLTVPLSIDDKFIYGLSFPNTPWKQIYYLISPGVKIHD